jgi:hypothetical protein
MHREQAGPSPLGSALTSRNPTANEIGDRSELNLGENTPDGTLQDSPVSPCVGDT